MNISGMRGKPNVCACTVCSCVSACRRTNAFHGTLHVKKNKKQTNTFYVVLPFSNGFKSIPALYSHNIYRVLFYGHSFGHQNQCHIHNFKFYMKSKFTAFTYNTSVCITPKLKKKSLSS